MTFAEITKNLRKERNLSQAELAEALQVSKACISMIEIGRNEPTAITLIKYADFFGCSIDYLLGRSDELGVISIKSQPFPTQLTAEEQRLLDVFRKLNTKNRMHVSAYAEVRLEDQTTDGRLPV